MGACASKFKRKKTEDENVSCVDDNADVTGAVEPLHIPSSMGEEVKMTADGRVVLPGEKAPSSAKACTNGGNPSTGGNGGSTWQKPSSSTNIKMTRAGTQIRGDSQDIQSPPRKTTMRINTERGHAAIVGGRRSTLSLAGAGRGTGEVSYDEDRQEDIGSSDDDQDDDELASASASSTLTSSECEEEDEESVGDEEIERELGTACDTDNSHRLHFIPKAVDSFSQSQQQAGGEWPEGSMDKENVIPNAVLPLNEHDLNALDEDAVAMMGDLTADGGMHLFMGTSIEKDSADLLAPLPVNTADGVMKRDRPRSEMLPINFWKKNELAYKNQQSTGGSVRSNLDGEGANRRGSVTGRNRVSIRINRQLSKLGSNRDMKSDSQSLSSAAGGKPSADSRFTSLRNMNKFEKKDFKRRESHRRATLGTRKKDRERLLSKVSLGRNHRRTTLATSDAHRVSKVIEEEAEKRVPVLIAAQM